MRNKILETENYYSDSYLTIEQMIHRGELPFSELEHVLDVLLQQENITLAEQQALLEFARQSQTPNPSAP